MKLIMRIAVGCGFGVIVALVLWHGLLRWLPWWAQAAVGGLIMIGWVVWACLAVAARADRLMEAAERAQCEQAIKVIGEDVRLRWHFGKELPDRWE